MAEIIGIFDHGIVKMGKRNLGAIRFRITTNEGKPEDLIGYCLPNYRDGIINNLKRIVWINPPADAETAGPDT